MSIIDAVILAIVQGLTEFLPVSSSGHLVLGREILGVANQGDNIAFEVFVHFGTFLAVLLVYWQDIKELLGAFFSAWMKPANLTLAYQTNAKFKLSVLMILAMIPAGFVGLFFEKELESLFADPKLVSGMLILTGLVLFLTRWVSKNATTVLNPRRALLIGLAQAVAIIPGVSRSGSTISTALLLGIDRKEAARFSFIMVLPLIFGALLLQILKLSELGVNLAEIKVLFTGLVISFVIGWTSLKWLIGMLERGHFHWFAYYCFAIGLIGLVYA